MSNVAQARYVISSFESGTYEVVGATGDWDTTNAQAKKGEVISLIRSLISCHESGSEINQENNFTDDSGMPPRWEDGREVYQGTNAFDW